MSVPNSGGQPATPPAVTFAMVQPAFSKDCSGGGCHSFGAQSSIDAGTKTQIYQFVSAGTMPPAGATPLSAADKQLILQFASSP